jgi:hypothetical protein
MRRKTLRKKTARKTRRRRIRGAGNKSDACAKYNLKGINTSTLPAPSKIDRGDEASLKAITSAFGIPANDMLILKVGSNDSLGAIAEGSRGKDGILFIEGPFKALGPESTTTLFDLRKVPAKPIGAFIRALAQPGYLPDSAHVVSLSPEPRYSEFAWPFEDSMRSDSEPYKQLITYFIDKIKTKTYVQSFFPIAPGGPEDPSTKLLNTIIGRPAPLLLFNAMGSVCFRAFKYIVDMRSAAGRTTIYMGLVDSQDVAACDVLSPIYPNADENCPQ